ncbi:hypothetical protein [Paenibacillus lutrae]|uniref:Uncharacterized protein n=1 Tax=Paenibacillus lutrae TaxID=2078573 RepID=A0A7X3FMS2_9BACL|nr:hypothetical protein [Paenibacillus lutrae]MVP02147.1 hypothetical protein [Paenibacillus lutrae]
MANDIRVIYRATARKTILVIGKYTNNGAKKAKVTVIRDYLGELSKGDCIKVPVDLYLLAARVHPSYVNDYIAADPDRIDQLMRKLLIQALNRKVEQLYPSQ